MNDPRTFEFKNSTPSEILYLLKYADDAVVADYEKFPSLLHIQINQRDHLIVSVTKTKTSSRITLKIEKRCGYDEAHAYMKEMQDGRSRKTKATTRRKN